MALAGYAIRFATGLLFIVAGVSKLSDRHGLETAIRNYRVLTPSLVRPVARFLPWAELFAGAALLLGIFLGVAVLLAAGLQRSWGALHRVRGPRREVLVHGLQRNR
ncbi:MAG: DoxX family membrane protein [Actinobacteria bacterium]|nr:DoxX family membrane protein [Actinomycetota bacterium]